MMIFLCRFGMFGLHIFKLPFPPFKRVFAFFVAMRYAAFGIDYMHCIAHCIFGVCAAAASSSFYAAD
jgi:hypothetical protein